MGAAFRCDCCGVLFDGEPVNGTAENIKYKGKIFRVSTLVAYPDAYPPREATLCSPCLHRLIKKSAALQKT